MNPKGHNSTLSLMDAGAVYVSKNSYFYIKCLKESYFLKGLKRLRKKKGSSD